MTDTKKKYNVMSIKGKIVAVESYGTGDNKSFSHQIVLPGKDEYSQVTGILVTAPNMLGAEDQIVDLDVEFYGFVKRFSYVDKESGEKKQGKSLDARFTFIKSN